MGILSRLLAPRRRSVMLLSQQRPPSRRRAPGAAHDDQRWRIGVRLTGGGGGGGGQFACVRPLQAAARLPATTGRGTGFRASRCRRPAESKRPAWAAFPDLQPHANCPACWSCWSCSGRDGGRGDLPHNPEMTCAVEAPLRPGPGRARAKTRAQHRPGPCCCSGAHLGGPVPGLRPPAAPTPSSTSARPACGPLPAADRRALKTRHRNSGSPCRRNFPGAGRRESRPCVARGAGSCVRPGISKTHGHRSRSRRRLSPQRRFGMLQGAHSFLTRCPAFCHHGAAGPIGAATAAAALQSSPRAMIAMGVM